MKPRIAGGEAPNTFLVAELELGLEERECPFVKWTEAKFFRRCSEQTRFLDHRQSECDDCDVGNGDVAESGNALNVRNFRPEILNGIVQIPGLRQCRAVLFEFFGGKCAIFVAEMHEHRTRADIAEPIIRILKGTEKRCIDSAENLCRQRCVEVVVESDIGDGVRVNTERNRYDGSSTNRERRRARMDGDNKCNTGSRKVIFVAKEKRQMAVNAAAARRGHGASVSIQLALQ